MANPPQLEPIIFRETRGQRTVQLIGAAFFGLTGIAGIWLGAPLGRFTVGLIWGAVGVPLALYILNLVAGRTTIDAQGVHAWQPLLRRSCPWSQVSDITLGVMSAKGSSTTYIQVKRKNGRSFRLPAPIDSTSGGNPRFKDQLETIRNYWEGAPHAVDQPDDLPAS